MIEIYHGFFVSIGYVCQTNFNVPSMKKFILFISLIICLSRVSAQNTIEMVPNGDFDKLNHYNIPLKVYKDYFKEKLVSLGKSYGTYRENGSIKWWEYKILNVYGLNDKWFEYPNTNDGGLDDWFYKNKSIHFLNSWYPYRNSQIQAVNFDSIVYQDSFHFYVRNQLEHYEIKDTWGFFDNAFMPRAKKSKLRVCGKNLYNMASRLSAPTKRGAYYVINLDLLYDYITHLNTMMCRKYFNNSDGWTEGVSYKLEAKFPDVMLKPCLLRDPGGYPTIGEIEHYCNITLDSDKFARNNNFKITLLNKFFDNESVKNKPWVSQDIWEMPLFSETNTEKHFEKRFKAAKQLNWIQLNQREPGTVSYYPNDTVRFSNHKDSLINLITFGGKYFDWPNPDIYLGNLHPNLGHWKRLKQWQYPGIEKCGLLFRQLVPQTRNVPKRENSGTKCIVPFRYFSRLFALRRKRNMDRSKIWENHFSW